MVWYLDTSALLKLVVAEAESPAMRAWHASHGPLWSSQLLRTEARRAGTRLGVHPQAIDDALDTVSLVSPSETTFRRAGELPPSSLRSLDALHLAAALDLGADLEGMVVYDERLAAAAAAHSVAVLTPH